MRPNETVGGTPNYAFRYLNFKNTTVPKVADLHKTIHGDMGPNLNLELNMELSELNQLRSFDTFFMTNVAKQKPRTTNLEMKPESYVRMYDIVVGAKQFPGFDRSGYKQYKEGLTEVQLGDSIKLILDKEPMEISREINKLQGQMSQLDLDLVITGYLSQGRVDFALELVKDADKYLISKDKRALKPEQLTEATLIRLFNPNINIGDNLFDIASVVLREYPNNELYHEIRNNILKWPKSFIDAVPVQTNHLDTLLGKKN